MKEYKVITQRDKYFDGKFDQDRLQKVLNLNAEQGWRVVTVTFGQLDISSGLGDRQDEMVVILERDK